MLKIIVKLPCCQILQTSILLCTFFFQCKTLIALPWNINDGKGQELIIEINKDNIHSKENDVSKNTNKDSTLSKSSGDSSKSSQKDETSEIQEKSSLISKIKGWHVLKTTLKGKQVCYAVNYPVEKIGNHTGKRKAYIMISYISSRQQEISIATGYRYRLHSKVNVSIDGEQFVFTSNDLLAWSSNIEDDFKIIKKMLTGIKIMTRAESVIGTYSIDVYLIDGFREAYRTMIGTCKD